MGVGVGALPGLAQWVLPKVMEEAGSIRAEASLMEESQS